MDIHSIHERVSRDHVNAATASAYEEALSFAQRRATAMSNRVAAAHYPWTAQRLASRYRKSPQGVWSVDASFSVVCNLGECDHVKDIIIDPVLSLSACSGDPPAAPTGATRTWDGSSKAVATVVTYTCADTGAVTLAVCDAATKTWLPATIPAC